MSGYLTVLIYEYAVTGLEKDAQTAATRMLNICFQVLILCFIISVSISHSFFCIDIRYILIHYV